MLAAEDAARMRAALEKLPDKKRALLVMRELEGLSAEEIGFALQMPEATVYSALHYARKDLLKQYRRLLALEAVR
jgi:RNA polymerase sigma-70 factor (ECF subfamily)